MHKHVNNSHINKNIPYWNDGHECANHHLHTVLQIKKEQANE